jgi:mono/diheme cytochrome c family protein
VAHSGAFATTSARGGRLFGGRLFDFDQRTKDRKRRLLKRPGRPQKSRLAMKKSETCVGNSVTMTSVALCFAVLGIVSAVMPVQAADAMNGERLAQRWCAACHVVTSDQRQANADAPPFEEIAKRPNFSESGLMTFLLDPHAKMPNMNLSRIEAGDIAAYVHRLQ